MHCGLAQEHCLPCGSAISLLDSSDVERLTDQLGAAWRSVDSHHLEREYSFDDFREALAFANQLGEIAEEENHHPDILVGWGKVRVTIYTHNVDGLTENDFILAAKFERRWRDRHH